MISPLNCGFTLKCFTPFLSVCVELMQINALPPREPEAPIRKSSCPPVPLIWREPLLSAATCPYRSTATQLFMDTMLSICDMTYGLFTYSSGYAAIPGLSSSHSYSSFEPMAQPNTPFPRSMFLYLFVSLPALYRARYASEQSSVCMARSLRSD